MDQNINQGKEKGETKSVYAFDVSVAVSVLRLRPNDPVSQTPNGNGYVKQLRWNDPSSDIDTVADTINRFDTTA